MKSQLHFLHSPVSDFVTGSFELDSHAIFHLFFLSPFLSLSSVYILVLPTTTSVTMEGLKEYFLLVSSLSPTAAAWPVQRLMERQFLELGVDFPSLVGLRLELGVF